MSSTISLLIIAAVLSQHWNCSQNERGLWQCYPPAEKAAVTAAAPEMLPRAKTMPEPASGTESAPAPDFVPEPEPESTPREESTVEAQSGLSGLAETEVHIGGPATMSFSPADGEYVLQIAAFQNKEGAQRYAAELAVPQVLLIPTRRDGRNWYVLVLGRYADYASATEAGRRYLHEHPAGAIWVRAAQGLKAQMVLPPGHP